MKKLLTVVFLIVCSVMILASDYETLYSEFVGIRALENVEMMSAFIGKLELEDMGNIEILTLLADSHREYANWIEDKKSRETHYRRQESLPRRL
jgi:hypothetical protein